MFSSGSASPQKLLYSPGGSDLLVFVCVHSPLSSLSSLRLSVKLPTVHRCCLTRGLHNTVKNSSLGEGAMNMEFLKCAPCVILSSARVLRVDCPSKARKLHWGGV